MIICGGRTYKEGDDEYGCGTVLTETESVYIREFKVKEHDSLCAICFSEKFADKFYGGDGI